MRDRKPRDVEHGGEVDRDHLVPVVGGIIGDRQCHAGDAGIVDQDVEAAELGDGVRHHALDVGAARHVAGLSNQPRNFLGIRRKRRGVDVADENPRAGRGKRARKFAANAGGAGSDQNPLRRTFPSLCINRSLTTNSPSKCGANAHKGRNRMDANLYDRIRERAYEIWFAPAAAMAKPSSTGHRRARDPPRRQTGHSGEAGERQEGEPAARPRHTEGRSGQLGAERRSPCWVYRPEARR